MVLRFIWDGRVLGGLRVGEGRGEGSEEASSRGVGCNDMSGERAAHSRQGTSSTLGTAQEEHEHLSSRTRLPSTRQIKDYWSKHSRRSEFHTATQILIVPKSRT